MQNLEDGHETREMSALKSHGEDYSTRASYALKPGRTLEIEVEVLGFGSNPPDAQASLEANFVIGKAIVSTSLSRHWEATIELMQANTNDRFLNMQIFAELLRCIRKICIDRFIGHLAMVDISNVSQRWYRDFFRLAGFSRCRCQCFPSGALQLVNRVCLASRKPMNQNSPAVYEKMRTWLAEGRCTEALLDSVASGEAAEVERRYFHDLLAELQNKNLSQSARMNTNQAAMDQVPSQRPWQESVKRLTAPRRKALGVRTGVMFLKKYWPSQDAVVKSTGGPASRLMEKSNWTRKAKEEGLWHTRKAKDGRKWRL